MTDLNGMIMADTIAAKAAIEDRPKIEAMRKAFEDGSLHFVMNDYAEVVGAGDELEVGEDVLANSKVACLIYFPFHLYERLRAEATASGLDVEQLVLATMREAGR